MDKVCYFQMAFYKFNQVSSTAPCAIGHFEVEQDWVELQILSNL